MAQPGLSMRLPITALLFGLTWPSHMARAHPLAFESPVQEAAHGRKVRVQADLARQVESSKGGADCQSPHRARTALTPVLSRWLGARMTERPTKRLAQWGYHSGNLWHEDRIVDGRPRCSGGFRKVIAFADFR